MTVMTLVDVVGSRVLVIVVLSMKVVVVLSVLLRAGQC